MLEGKEVKGIKEAAATRLSSEVKAEVVFQKESCVKIDSFQMPPLKWLTQSFLGPPALDTEVYAHLRYLLDVWSVVAKAQAFSSLVSFDLALKIGSTSLGREGEPLLDAHKDRVSKSTRSAPGPRP